MADDPRLSDAEWTVMNAVWQGAPCSARDVLDRVSDETGWAYTTVRTLLTRLVEKGALTVRQRANAGVYRPVIERSDARRSALRSLLERAFDGSFGGLLQHMVTAERLSRKDRDRLRRLLGGKEQTS